MKITKLFTKMLLATMLVGVMAPIIAQAEDYTSVVNNCTKANKNYKNNVFMVDTKAYFLQQKDKCVTVVDDAKSKVFNNIILIWDKGTTNIKLMLLNSDNVVYSAILDSNETHVQSHYSTLIKEFTTYYLNKNLIKNTSYVDNADNKSTYYKYTLTLDTEVNIDDFKTNSRYFNSTTPYNIYVDDMKIPIKYLNGYVGDTLVKYTITTQDGETSSLTTFVNIKGNVPNIEFPINITYSQNIKSLVVDVYKPIEGTALENIKSDNIERLSSIVFNQTTKHNNEALIKYESYKKFILLGVLLIYLAVALWLSWNNPSNNSSNNNTCNK